MNLDHLRADLMVDEGCRLKPYVDTTGNTTIGYGHKGIEDVMLDIDGGISEQYALDLLERDMQKVAFNLNIVLPWWINLGDPRETAMANMAFNLGVEGLLEFRETLVYLKSGDFDNAAKEMLNSKWATQVRERAVRLANVVRTGVYQYAGQPASSTNS